jgi:DNA (cytosine-5)-methyltransferase 3A
MMNVLSLFDGISCGMIALNRSRIKVDNYFSSEVDKNSITISKENYPNIIRTGDVRNIDSSNLPKIDLLIGGSPCQSFSIAGKMKGMSTKENIEIISLKQYLKLKKEGFEFEGQSYLFWEYVRVLKEVKPKYFLLENVKMLKKWQDVISKALEVEPILINSALVSAQNRKRLYWTNIPNIKQPEDKGVLLKDILEDWDGDVGVEIKTIPHGYMKEDYKEKEKYPSLCAQTPASKHLIRGAAKRNQVTKRGIEAQLNIRKDSKSNCVVSSYSEKLNGCVIGNEFRPLSPLECERLQTLPDGYTESVKKTQRYKAIGNGWTVDVISHIFSYLPEEFKLKQTFYKDLI